MTFLTEIVPFAQQIQKKYNILASVILAQACLESSFGKSGLATQGKNLFGVKGKYQGQSVTMETLEYNRGSDVPYKINAAFRKYPSWYESLEDLALLYHNGVSWDREKYHAVIGEQNIKQACESIQNAGYATDPKYAEKLIEMIEKYNLTQYDGPKEGSRVLKLSDSQFNMLTKAYTNAHKKGILSSEEWQKKAAEKTLTVDEAIFLNTVIVDRLIK